MTKKFSFGENWHKFTNESFSKERLNISTRELLNSLRLENLEEKTFIDIGCGSGIHSMSAWKSRARTVLSIDIDPQSVLSTLKLHELSGKPKNWEIQQGSILDSDFISKFGNYDVVYSWGVLHHTGNRWNALRNISSLINENGILFIALYADEMYHTPSPQFWIDIKKKYNEASTEKKTELEEWYAWEYSLKPYVTKGINPFTAIRNYKESRGMEFWTDVRDWLGGYPMDFAKTKDVVNFFLDECGLEVLDIKTGLGNTEFIFRKKHSINYWDSILSNYEIIHLNGNIESAGGCAYKLHIPQFRNFADDDSDRYRSEMKLLEDGRMIGFAHARHKSIGELGEGRFCHWKDDLLFSASDNSDARTNKKKYSIRVPKKI